MTETTAKTKHPAEYVIERYQGAIAYYWRAARLNKLAYKWFRYLTIVLSALVSLAATLSSTDAFSDQTPWMGTTLTVTTPIIATLLTILTGFAQTFQWGATWRESVMTASRLERELDRIRVTTAEERDAQKDLRILNRLVLTESDGFFDRLLGRGPADQTDDEEPTASDGQENDEAKAPA